MNQSSQRERMRLTLAYTAGLLSAHMALCPGCRKWIREARKHPASSPSAIAQIVGCLLTDAYLFSRTEVHFQDLADVVRSWL